MDDTLTPFRCISGNGVYGVDIDDEALIIGFTDTPVEAVKTHFMIRRVLIIGVSENTAYKIQFLIGTGTFAEAVANSSHHKPEIMVKYDAINPQQSAGIPITFPMHKQIIGTKIWARCKNVTDDATIDFYIGFKEFPVDD